MKNLKYLGLSFVLAAQSLVLVLPASAQNFNFGGGNSVSNGNFSFGGNGMNGGGSTPGYTGSFRTYDQAQSAATGRRFVEPAGAHNQGAWGTQFFSSGAQGDRGVSHDSGLTPGELCDSDRSLHNYQSTRSDRGSKDQVPQTRGGLPFARTAVDSLNGSFGSQFGYTQVPSGQFKYGFDQRRGWSPYLGTCFSESNPPSIGRFLPPTSTTSLDINTVSR